MFQTDQYNGRNILVIGGLGFIGSNLAARLVDLGAQVLIVDSLIPEYGGNLFNIEPLKDQVTVNIADVRDEHSIRYLVQGHEFLINLAGQTSHLYSMPIMPIAVAVTVSCTKAPMPAPPGRRSPKIYRIYIQ